MTISNLDKFKRQVKAGLPVFLITVGFILMIASVIAFWNGSLDYQEQLAQRDWLATNATVSYVEEKIEHSNTPGNYGHTFTYYDIHYDYMVDGQIYSGRIEDRNMPENIGDSFEIKYNPNAPEKSTHILEASKSFVVSGSVFAALALTMVALAVVLLKKSKKLNAVHPEDHSSR